MASSNPTDRSTPSTSASRMVPHDPEIDVHHLPSFGGHGGTDQYSSDPALKPIDYSGVGPKDYQRPDHRVYEEVCEALLMDPKVDASQIHVEVKEGVVTLSGSVPEREMKWIAEDCTDHVPGVKDVLNYLSSGDRGRSRYFTAPAIHRYKGFI